MYHIISIAIFIIVKRLIAYKGSEEGDVTW